MTATLGSAKVGRALLRLPRYGAWVAEVTLVDDTALAIGSQQTLAIGDLSLVGTVTAGGDFGGAASYTVVAGAGAWGTQIPSLPYHDDSGILLSRVFADLVQAAGEMGGTLAVTDRILGQDWTRPTGAARDQLDALTTPRGQWWVDPAGTTHLGPVATSSLTAASTLSVTSYDPETLHAVVQDAGDAIAALAPGVTLTAPGLPAALTIAAVVVRVDTDAIVVDLWGESPLSELLGRLIDARTAWRLFLPPTPYAVQTVASDGRVAVQPGDARAATLPGDPAVGHAPGLPGATYTLKPGATVLLAWAGGDPGSPIVVAHPTTSPETPAKVTLTADELDLGASGGHFVVVDNGLAAWFAAVRTGILAAHGTDPGPPPTITATKVKAT